MKLHHKVCPKCNYVSGDSWAQCEGQCPMPMSPDYDAVVAMVFADNEQFGGADLTPDMVAVSPEDIGGPYPPTLPEFPE